MNKKIGICGHFGGNKNFVDGQTIKTKILHNELSSIMGEELDIVDTYNWKKNIFNMISSSIKLAKNNKNIIIISSINGRKIFIPLFYVLGLIFKNSIYCMVIGGGFPEQIDKNKILKLFSKRIDGIFVETTNMLIKLEHKEFKNVYLLNNFKNLNIIDINELNYNYTTPFKLCTFSRVCKKKGIEDAINVIKEINKNEIKYELDIYGQIETGYLKEFETLIKNGPSYIKYKGIVEYDKSVDVIKNYFALLFPTLYSTEGVPGTIIDAYAAGVPVIASEWDSCNDVIDNNATGIVYELGNNVKLKQILEKIYVEPRRILDLKSNCLKKSEEYLTRNVITKFIDILNKIDKENREYEN